jgi:hypothetical protein
MKQFDYGAISLALNTHAAVYNLFNLGRHLVSAKIIDILDCAPLRLGKRQWQLEMKS